MDAGGGWGDPPHQKPRPEGKKVCRACGENQSLRNRRKETNEGEEPKKPKKGKTPRATAQARGSRQTEGTPAKTSTFRSKKIPRRQKKKQKGRATCKKKIVGPTPTPLSRTKGLLVVLISGTTPKRKESSEGQKKKLALGRGDADFNVCAP